MPLSAALQREIDLEEEVLDAGGDPYDPPSPGPPATKTEKAQPLPATGGEDPNKVGWDGPNDLENPKNWSTSYKWFLTGVISFVLINV